MPTSSAMPIYTIAQPLPPPSELGRIPISARALALLLVDQNGTVRQLRAWSGLTRGGFNKAWALAQESGLIVEVSLQDLAFGRPTPGESPPAPATPEESNPMLLTPRESPPAPATPEESGLLTLKLVSSSSSSSSGRATTTTAATPQESAWLTAQAALALQLTAHEYDTLVAPCRFLACEDGELRVLVPNTVSRDLLGNRLRPWLKENLARQLGEYVDVRLLLDAGAPPEPAADPADVLRRLKAYQVHDPIAQRLVREPGVECCLRHLAALDRLMRIQPPARPGGWLVRAIEEDWRHDLPERDRWT